MHKKLLSIALLVGVLCITSFNHASGEEKFKLAVTIPTETMLWNNGLPAPDEVWVEMIKNAEEYIYLGQFYVAEMTPSRLTPVLKELKNASQRGVHISLMVDKKMIKYANDNEGLEFLKKIPDLEWMAIDYSKISGGAQHAKYMVVDGLEAYVGSQNFDWRSLEHIHEMGVWTSDHDTIEGLELIFLQDWLTQIELEETGGISDYDFGSEKNCRYENHLASSPPEQNPIGIAWSETELICLISSANVSIDIQVMQYGPYFYNKTLYCKIDWAIREAAKRGVMVQLMVADWGTKEPWIYGLYDLATLRNVEVQVVTIPPASTGFIPFSRVIHSKYMVVDNEALWVETGNWTGDYFVKARNIALWLEEPKLAKQAQELFDDLWFSAYAEPVEPMCYPRVKRK